MPLKLAHRLGIHIIGKRVRGDSALDGPITHSAGRVDRKVVRTLDRGELEEIINRAQLQIGDSKSFYEVFERSYKPPRRHAAADVRYDERFCGKPDQRKKKR